ncbi:MAG: autotransporter outer membrane beta-barrel domain-containing protein [Verrucomicrobiota bacterium]
MKLKNTNKLALRALAITAALVTAQAAVITVTSNYTQDTVSNNVLNNGTNTVVANTGGSTLTFGTGAVLLGNGASPPAALQIAGTGYTLNNSGLLEGLTAGTTAGVTVGATAIIHNLLTGTIRSVNASSQGIIITAGSGSTITNAHIIEGSEDAIRTQTNTLSVTNAATGIIRGITGPNSDGIQTLSGLAVDNSGSITGNATGINAGATANITNRAGATITGTSAGISVSNGLVLTNEGTIHASAVTGNGVMATTGAQIDNKATGTISGGNDGVQVGSGATIKNAGTIVGTVGNGVKLADGSVDNTNAGWISGTNAGVQVTTGAGIVTNTGTATITGTTIGINFGGINAGDTLNMNGGTLIGGSLAAPTIAVDGGTGANDTLNFNGTAATVVGSVLRMETINRNGTGVASITGATINADTITLAVGNLGSLYLYGTVAPSTLPTTTIIVNSGVFGGSSEGSTWNSNLTFNGGSLLVHINPSTSLLASPPSDLIKVSGNVSVAAASVIIAPISKDAPLQGSIHVLGVGGTRLGGQFTSPATFYFEPTFADAGPLVAATGSGAITSSTVSMNVVSGDPALGQNANDSYVKVVHHYDAPVGFTPVPLTSFGKQLGTFLNSRLLPPQQLDTVANPILADFLGYLDYSSAATVVGVLNAYEPMALQASIVSTVVGARDIHRIVEQQNAGDRLYPTNAHVWGNFNYDNLTSNGNSSRETLGAGWAIDTVHLGALVSYADSSIGSGANDEVWSYGAYLAMGQATGWQWNAYIGGSEAKATSTRSLAISPQVDSTVHFDPKGNGFQALLSGGYMMEQGGCNWGPTFGMEYTKAKMDGGVRRAVAGAEIKPGNDLPAMDFSADNLHSLRSLLGMRADFTFSSNIRPYLSAQWAHEFEGESSGYTAGFQGASFNVNAPFALDTDTLILRAGLIVGFGESIFGDIGYLGEVSINGNGGDYNGINIGLRASF